MGIWDLIFVLVIFLYVYIYIYVYLLSLRDMGRAWHYFHTVHRKMGLDGPSSSNSGYVDNSWSTFGVDAFFVSPKAALVGIK